MTPAARVAAAIEVLDAVLAGAPAERVLTGWGRDNRYAGSGDRAAVRDHVFDALRRRRSYAALGGAETGRGIMLGAIRAEQADPAEVFTGQGHAPAPLSDDERAYMPPVDLPDPVRLDMPDWLYPRLTDSLGDQTENTLAALRDRAPVHLRVNLRKGPPEAAIASLEEDQISAVRHPDVKTALQVIGNERKIKMSKGYLSGLVELQDAASQAAMLRLPLNNGDRVIDYCAGGGGKSLAMGALADLVLYAHDSNPARMADLPARAVRAKISIEQIKTEQLSALAYVDLVLIDAPCSGSGTWRRTPDAKWRLTPDNLDALRHTQADILDSAAPLVRQGGTLAYATCSILAQENRDQVDAFLSRSAGWTLQDEMRLFPSPLHDGFYLAVLERG